MKLSGGSSPASSAATIRRAWRLVRLLGISARRGRPHHADWMRRASFVLMKDPDSPVLMGRAVFFSGGSWDDLVIPDPYSLWTSAAMGYAVPDHLIEWDRRRSQVEERLARDIAREAGRMREV